MRKNTQYYFGFITLGIILFIIIIGLVKEYSKTPEPPVAIVKEQLHPYFSELKDHVWFTTTESVTFETGMYTLQQISIPSGSLLQFVKFDSNNVCASFVIHSASPDIDGVRFWCTPNQFKALKTIAQIGE